MSTWALAWLAFFPVASELYHGNIDLILAAAIVAGFRWPVAWAVVLHTKLTPGIGLLWFAVRREWRPLLIAGAATIVQPILGIIGFSMLAALPRLLDRQAVERAGDLE